MATPFTAAEQSSPRKAFSWLQELLARNQDLGLVLLVVAVIALMIFPLPYAVMDTLIAANITISVLVLLTAMYVPEALKLSTFPSMLLFTTLLRLGLNIASTKLILLHAHAGEIIETFGRLVVGGNFVVGGVVYLIITIVQFIVIAKGAERVAEVGARFTLDGMPGKQMSIDADLRAGVINADEARYRRGLIERESQLHGGMDGAMKFVKGDAIASLIISLICIVAGICIGTLMLDMSAGEAATRYSVLTVGDGMVSQIPSLFLSIAAGILITRANDNRGAGSNLGRDIGTQLIAQPRAMIVTGVILLACAAVPGFPKIQFILLALAIGVPGIVLMRKVNAAAKRNVSVTVPEFSREGRRDAPLLVDSRVSPTSIPIRLQCSEDLLKRIDAPTLGRCIQATRERIHSYIGVPFPGMKIVVAKDVAANSFQLSAFDVPIGTTVHIPPDHVLINATPTAALALGLPLLPDIEAPLEANCWIEASGIPMARDNSVEVYGFEDTVARYVERVIRTNAAVFIGMQESRILLSRAEYDYPEIVAEVTKALPLQRITEVFRRLVEEGVPLRDLRSILEALATWGPREKDVVMLTEQVRSSLSRYLTHQYSNGTGAINAILLSPQIEDALRQAVQQSRGGSYVAVSPEQARHLSDQIDNIIKGSELPDKVVVTRAEIRRYVKKILEPYQPALVVLSYEEISSSASLNTVGQVQS